MKVSQIDIEKYIEIINSLGVKYREIYKTGYDSGYELIIPRGKKLNIPISLVFVSDKDEQKVYNRIIVEEGAYAKLYTYCTSLHSGLHIGKTVGIIKGMLDSAKIHKIDSQSKIISINRYKIDRGLLRNYLVSGDSKGESINDNKFKVSGGTVEEYIFYRQKISKRIDSAKKSKERGECHNGMEKNHTQDYKNVLPKP